MRQSVRKQRREQESVTGEKSRKVYWAHAKLWNTLNPKSLRAGKGYLCKHFDLELDWPKRLGRRPLWLEHVVCRLRNCRAQQTELRTAIKEDMIGLFTSFLVWHPSHHSPTSLPTFLLFLIYQHDRTPLHLAAQRGHSVVAEFLVDKLKANVNLRTKVWTFYMEILLNSYCEFCSISVSNLLE